MSYYLFPKGNIDILKDISMSLDNTSSTSLEKYLSPSLVFYLQELQEQERELQLQEIDITELQKSVFPFQKGIFEKYINYRACFFEIIEIVQTMHLNHYLDMISKNNPLSIFSFEEEQQKAGIAAIKTIREPYKRITSEKHKINTISPIHLPYKDNYFFTESEYSLLSFRNIYFNYGSKMHVILADSTKCKTIQEMIIQLSMILCIQARKGILFWKVSDTYTEILLDIFVLLSSFYEKTYFIKPVIMDISRSEKYIVCKGFTLENAYTIYPVLYRMISLLKLPPGLVTDSKEKEIQRLLSKPIPHFFVSKLEEINYMFGQAQLEQLHYLSVLMSHKYKHEKIQNISKINAQKTQEWLVKHHYFLQNLSFH
jgi:hypothetical protein